MESRSNNNTFESNEPFTDEQGVFVGSNDESEHEKEHEEVNKANLETNFNNSNKTTPSCCVAIHTPNGISNNCNNAVDFSECNCATCATSDTYTTTPAVVTLTNEEEPFEVHTFKSQYIDPYDIEHNFAFAKKDEVVEYSTLASEQPYERCKEPVTWHSEQQEQQEEEEKASHHEVHAMEQHYHIREEANPQEWEEEELSQREHEHQEELEEEREEEEQEEEVVEFRHRGWFVNYIERLKGAGAPGPPWFCWSKDAIPSSLFSIITLLILSFIYVFGLDKYNLGLSSLLPSFGASCTLVMFMTTTPGAQPRALVSTHFLGAFLGLSFAHIAKSLPSPLNEQLASAFGVSVLTSWMMLTGTFQPSASATTCLAAFHLYGEMRDQGYMFLVTPALIGPIIIVFMGWVLNNLVPWRRPYPLWW